MGHAAHLSGHLQRGTVEQGFDSEATGGEVMRDKKGKELPLSDRCVSVS